MAKIKPKEREAIIQSLSAGVVPRIGLQHIAVDRKFEIEAFDRDLKLIQNDGATIRFVIGRWGSGKSFLLHLARIIALEKKFVVTQADISLDKRLHATDGKAVALYSELMHNLCVKTKTDGGAIRIVIENWINDVEYPLRQQGKREKDIIEAINRNLRNLLDSVGGYDFAQVLGKYYEGYLKENDELIESTLRWLHGEYNTKSEAKKDLGVKTIITDEDVYNYLKLWGSFSKMAGYSGLLVNLDEMGVISHRFNNSLTRNANYEVLLKIVNDCLQGNVSRIGFIFAGTDDFYSDKKRGIVSHNALATRLDTGNFPGGKGFKNLYSPVLHLENLTLDDTYLLLQNIRNVFAMGDPNKFLIPDEAIEKFMQSCSKTLGAEYYQTPRDIIKNFISYLSYVEQAPKNDWNKTLNNFAIKRDQSGDSDEDLESFKL